MEMFERLAALLKELDSLYGGPTLGRLHQIRMHSSGSMLLTHFTEGCGDEDVPVGVWCEPAEMEVFLKTYVEEERLKGTRDE